MLSIAEWTDRALALSSPMKLTSSASFSPSIRISLRLKIHQAQAKNFCRVLDIRVPQGVEGKVPDVSIFQQAVVVILESFLLKVVSKLVGDDEAIIGVLIPCPNLVLHLLLFPAGKLVCHCAGQRNRAAGVFRFGCTEYDLGFVLAVVGFVLGKAVDGTAYMKLRGRKVNMGTPSPTAGRVALNNWTSTSMPTGRWSTPTSRWRSAARC